ncbi:MAG: hypothetical protein DRH12_18040 [Deltaproteobacteria bacterium]|nr:MAG: hypothetical protein DRH12_18040 [Deltaproteobacteria bacterium]
MIRKDGFTLIELMITIAIFAIIMVGLYPIYTHITTFNMENYIRTALNDNLRAGMDRLSRELREATDVNDPDDPDNPFPDGEERNSIVFIHPDPQNPETDEMVKYVIATSSAYSIPYFPEGKELRRYVWNGTDWEGGNPITEPIIHDIVFKRQGQLIKIAIISRVILRKGKEAQDYIFIGNIGVRNALP